MVPVVKNLPTMRETWVLSLGREDSLEKGIPTPVFLPGESHEQRSLTGYMDLQSMGLQRVGQDFTFTFFTDYSLT